MRKPSKIAGSTPLGRNRSATLGQADPVVDKLPAHSELLARIGQFAPHLLALLSGPQVDPHPLPLEQKNTDDLLGLLEFGWLQSEVATIWRVDPGHLFCWIAADSQRAALARLARKAQAEIWDRVAFAIALFAPGDRVEMARAKLLMDHCKWRSAMYDPDEYVKRLSVKNTTKNKDAHELTTSELLIIAGGDAPHNRL